MGESISAQVFGEFTDGRMKSKLGIISTFLQYIRNRLHDMPYGYARYGSCQSFSKMPNKNNTKIVNRHRLFTYVCISQSLFTAIGVEVHIGGL